MIAGDPNPVAAALQALELDAIEVGHAQRPVIVVETVAQRDENARRIVLHKTREPPQRRRRVVRRQQDAALGEGRAFLQMQIGDDQQLFVRPKQRPGRIGD